MFNYIWTFLNKKEQFIWVLFGHKQLHGVYNSYVVGIFTTETKAKHEMDKINNKYEIKENGTQIFGRAKYFSYYVMKLPLNTVSNDELFSLEEEIYYDDMKQYLGTHVPTTPGTLPSPKLVFGRGM
jgi:hypothetical protein